jgi:hypothetical protein
MEKEIAKRFLKGISASSGIVIGMGLVDLSMNPVALLEAKKIIRSTSYGHLKSVVKKALNLPTAEEIIRLISFEYDRMDLPSRRAISEISGNDPENLLESATKINPMEEG